MKMKKLITFTIYLMIIFLISLSEVTLNAQETIVHDEIIDWGWELGPWYGGNSFYWWHRSYERDIVDYGDMSPTDWLSPYNYRDGEFFLRFEVISQPSSENFYIQFGIWQDYGKTGGYSETVSSLAELNGGDGSLVETSIGTPRRWWQKRSDDPVDFRRPEDFYRIGIILWNTSPLCLPMAQGWNNDNACSNAATVALRFFPMQARVTVVAVAEGYNFSGWENYVGKPDTPEYTIDFGQEQTGEEVPAEVEYASNPDMSDATDGSGARVPLTPGEDLYFRVKASGNNPASDILHLEVPDRPEAPLLTFSIDYESEKTAENVPDNIEFSENSDFTEKSQGNNAPVDFPPGTAIYFRFMATENSFASEMLSLESDSRPPAPAIGINYPEEVTDTIPAGLIYGSDMEFAEYIEGDGSPVAIDPGSIIYLRKKPSTTQYASEIQTLVVPERPVVPTFTIDFAKESTRENIPTLLHYSSSQDMSSPESGTDETLSVTPGSDLYFQVPASDSSFKSDIYELEVPERPALQLIVPEPVSVVPVPIEVLFTYDVTGFSADGILITNGTVDSVDSDLIAFITPQSDGFVQLFIPPNVVEEGNFTSFNLRFQFNEATGLGEHNNNNSYRVFPSPASNQIMLELDRPDLSPRYEIWSIHAKVLKSGLVEGRQTLIALDDLTSGVYFIALKCNGCQDLYIQFIKE
jgi:hypothetical protein